MSGSDTIELKRVRQADEDLEFRRQHYFSELDWPRPHDSPPHASAPHSVRANWSMRFVPWYFTQTGGEPEHPDGVPAGHRWRLEFFECVADPVAFEIHAKREIEDFKSRGGS